MALFTDESTASADAPRRRGGLKGWAVLGVALVAGIALGVVPSPYVIEQPGPVFNTLGTATNADDVETPLIHIDGEPVYPTKGSLDLLTVSLFGNQETRPSWLAVAGAWLDPSKAVIPVDQVFPVGITSEQRDTRNQAAMVNSQQDAIAAALTHLEYDYPMTVSVVGLPDDSPAAGLLAAGDVVTSIDDTPVRSISELRAALQVAGTDAPVVVGITRDGTALTESVAPVRNAGSVVLGIGVTTNYTFPFTVELELDRVGGPSAGMMFALGIIDKLTPGELQGGASVAGTGTIDQAGTVGTIGGIQQKLYGAKDAGADWFLAPAENCDEVTGHIPKGLTVFSVQTLDDALAALDVIRTGDDPSSLPTCATK
ncbi:YlbL family protein [Cryobacterium psychrophilum]|uniref:endopeptidase La n=1 Tax=Cryobacterium psychrophilum TaxID=41988 RepID=A0A4Y8KWA8_9MICO|nr:S16 family serine protease [Cryobacterium psychrophilum]TDW30929.1 PDZ domain-containing protein [Cryobacterium psychrophilum]TFD80801.1 PDZ domain-containing protein [Cryobacterium psychrophilum]